MTLAVEGMIGSGVMPVVSEPLSPSPGRSEAMSIDVEDDSLLAEADAITSAHQRARVNGRAQ